MPHPEVHAHFNRQHGLITRRQALEAGLCDHQIIRLLRSGVWTTVHRGVYADSEVVRAATSTRDRRLLVDRAASLQITMPHVASHDFAAHELGLPLLDPEDEYTHVTRPRVVGAHLKHGVKHHLAPFADSEVVDVGGRRVLGPARTALDLTREHGLLAGVAGLDAARARGVSLAEIAKIRGRMHCWPGSQLMDQAVDLSDPGADSLLETIVRLALKELGLGPVRSQVGLTDGGRTAWIDLMIGRHCVECDGKVKYRRIDEGGYAKLSAEQVLWEEKLRQDWVCGFKLGMSRVVWDDMFGRRRAITLARLDREIRDTRTRFGDDVSDLLEFQPRGERPRPQLRVA